MKHIIPEAALKEAIAIIGRTGSGKSYAAKGAVERLLTEGRRMCIVDPTGIWWGLRSSADGKRAAFSVAVFGGDHADVPIGDGAGAALASLVAGGNIPAIVDLSGMTMGGRVRFMTAFLDTLYASNKAPIHLIVDEADLFAPQRPMPDQTVMLSRMEQIVRRGRVRGFRPWLITQRPAELHKSVLSQAATLVAMKLTAPQDRDAIGAWIEGQADRDEGKRILADLPKLAKGEAWVWSPGHDLLSRVKFPAIKTFDSGRTPDDDEPMPQVTLADVNIADIAASLKAADEDAAKNDPKLLRKRISELEQKLRQNALQGHSNEDIERARQAGEVAGMRRVIGSMRKAHDLMRKADQALQEARNYVGLVIVEEPPAVKQNDQFAERARLPDSVKSASSNGSLPRAERLALTAIAQYPQGRSAQQVAVITGYAVNGGGFRNALGALRSKGYIVGSGEAMTATPAGIAALGDFDPLPTGRALLDHWYRQLGKAERKALEALADAYPGTLSVQQIANRAGYEADGGGFRNALGRLRTLELITGRRDIKASDNLFG